MLIRQDIREKLIENLVKLYPIIVNNSKKPFDKEKIISYYKNEKKLIQFFNLSEKENYYNFVDNLFSIIEIKKNFSTEFIEEMLIDILHLLIETPEQELNETIRNQIDLIEKILFDNIKNEWVVIFPLENIRIVDNEMKNTNVNFNISGSRIYRFNKEEIERIENETELKLDESFFSVINNKICIETRLFAGDIKKVKENGYSKIDESLNFLRVFIPYLKIDVEGFLSQGASFMIAMNLKTKRMHEYGFNLREIITNHFYINQSFYEYLEKIGLYALNYIYENNESDAYANKIKTAIHWFGSASKDRLDRDKFLKLMICLETLLKTDKEKDEITKTISERLAILIGIDFNSRKKIFKDMKELYGIRSAIVHGGKKEVEQDKLNMLMSYVENSIVKILDKYVPEYGFEKMISDLDDLKFQIDNKLLW